MIEPIDHRDSSGGDEQAVNVKLFYTHTRDIKDRRQIERGRERSLPLWIIRLNSNLSSECENIPRLSILFEQNNERK